MFLYKMVIKIQPVCTGAAYTGGGNEKFIGAGLCSTVAVGVLGAGECSAGMLLAAGVDTVTGTGKIKHPHIDIQNSDYGK